jgi:hypothetical protein
VLHDATAKEAFDVQADSRAKKTLSAIALA